MILPGKHLKPDRSLLGIGGDILQQLEQSQTVSELWERVQENRNENRSALSFDWFIMSLAFLSAIDAVRYDRGILIRTSSP